MWEQPLACSISCLHAVSSPTHPNNLKQAFTPSSTRQSVRNCAASEFNSSHLSLRRVNVSELPSGADAHVERREATFELRIHRSPNKREATGGKVVSSSSKNKLRRGRKKKKSLFRGHPGVKVRLRSACLSQHTVHACCYVHAAVASHSFLSQRRVSHRQTALGPVAVVKSVISREHLTKGMLGNVRAVDPSKRNT